MIKLCKYCSKEFEPKSSKGEYCNIECKNKWLWATYKDAKLKYRKHYRLTAKGRATTLFHSAKSRAGTKYCDFTLTKDWIQTKIELGMCEVTGIKFKLEEDEESSTNPYAPSLDRIDIAKGYTPDNTRVVIWGYNTARNQFSDVFLKELASAILKKNPRD